MPVEFLTDDQAEAYGKFAEEPTRPELERFFFLDDVDRDLIALRRTKHHQLGFALQMCTVRYVGLFLEDPLAVPWPVVEHLAVQLGIEDPSCVKRYTERLKTAYEHSWEIRDAYGYHPYEDAESGRKFRTFLHGRAWTHAEGPVALFNQAVGWLRRNRVLLPGVSVLARQVSEVRTIAEKRLHATVARAAHRADPALPTDLVATLVTPEGGRYSELERLRRPPTRTTGTAFARSLERVDEIGAFQLGRLKLSQIPPNRLAALARYGLGSKAASLERAAEPKRTAMLTAVMRHLEAKAIDEALDLFSVLMATRLISTAKRATDKERLSTLPQLEKASRTLARAAKVLFEELELVEAHGTDLDAAALWRAVEEVAPRAAVMSAAVLVVSLVPEDEDSAAVAMRAALATRYNTVRPFLSLLGESKALDAATGGKRVLAGVKRLPALARRRVKDKPLLPREVDDKLVPAAWRKAVYANAELPPGAVDRDAYVVCVLEQLHRALQRRDVFASPSHRWSDPRARLLDGTEWEAVRDDVLAGLSLDMPVEEHAAPSPKYFGFKRGITWLNAVNDQVAGIGQMVVPGTPRDSLHILDALLNLDGGVKPEMVATDNASYSDIVFGIFRILGYNFSPRFKDLDDQRFWRASFPGVETGTYGPLEPLARNRVNLDKVITHWPDMLRVAGSLVTNQVRAYDLLRMFGREGHPTPLGQAFAEYGRIAKTEHLLRVVDPVDDTYRRQMNRQLTVQESRHKLARDVCHGKRGTIHQAYRDGMEDQLGSLGLVLNAVVLWTTRYIDAAVARLRAEGHEIRDEDIARLSPLKHRNLNVLGRYSFTASTPAGGALRPLRDPDTVELDEDDEG
ncbi:Tn3 family transposase [Streptomyces sp. NPDC001292]|uniref:Tn3 family transposase n=1 Tax=Streptomyces sp. NPDC001292 TaxID=3364558 RepID=UPI0036957CD0